MQTLALLGRARISANNNKRTVNSIHATVRLCDRHNEQTTERRVERVHKRRAKEMDGINAE